MSKVLASFETPQEDTYTYVRTEYGTPEILRNGFPAYKGISFTEAEEYMDQLVKLYGKI